MKKANPIWKTNLNLQTKPVKLMFPSLVDRVQRSGFFELLETADTDDSLQILMLLQQKYNSVFTGRRLKLNQKITIGKC